MKIKKSYNITLIFALISGLFLCPGTAYSLRAPLRESIVTREKAVGWLVEKGLLANGVKMPSKFLERIDEILEDYKNGKL